MPGEITTFAELPVGDSFTANGNVWTKISSRTAKLIEFNRTFYFGKREIVTVGRPS